MKCLILCGGFGTRSYHLTVNQPKPLLEYRDKPVLTHIVEKIPQGLDILIATNRRFEGAFRRWGKGIDRQVEICVEDAWNEEQKKGAVSSLNFWVISQNITEDLLVIAGDNYFEFDLAQFVAAYDGRNALVAVYDIGDRKKASQFGVVKLDRHKIIELEEKPAEPGSSLIATAVYILPSHIFPRLSQYCAEAKRDNLGSFIAYLLNKEEVYAYTFAELWLDIGSSKSL